MKIIEAIKKSKFNKKEIQMGKRNNTGNCNTGDWNTGDWNTGNRNTGDCNTGNCNTGDWNTGDCNTGDWNTGDCNTGDWNTGDWNTGNRNTGDCNTTLPSVRMFNGDSGWDFFDNNHSKFKFIVKKYSKPLCEWVSDINMTETEKKENPSYETTGGYLKVNENLRNDVKLSEEDAEFLRSVPNFDADILLETTGIDINGLKKKIVIDGKEILISAESFEEMKRQFVD